jgi:hypothetical protein
MVGLLKNLDVVAVLSLGATGLGFFLAIFAYWLLGREQRVNRPRANMLKAINIYMVFAILLVMLGIFGRFLDKHSISKHPTPEVRQAIKGLSPIMIERLVAMSPDLLQQVPPDPTTKSINDTLVSSKLAKELTFDELSGESMKFGSTTKFVYGIGLTPLGSDAKAYVEGVLVELVNAD